MIHLMLWRIRKGLRFLTLVLLIAAAVIFAIGTTMEGDAVHRWFLFSLVAAAGAFHLWVAWIISAFLVYVTRPEEEGEIQ